FSGNKGRNGKNINTLVGLSLYWAHKQPMCHLNLGNPINSFSILRVTAGVRGAPLMLIDFFKTKLDFVLTVTSGLPFLLCLIEVGRERETPLLQGDMTEIGVVIPPPHRIVAGSGPFPQYEYSLTPEVTQCSLLE
ncbi:hypothetical protein J6590_096167, partial [Homalodisca vitripennis]